MSPAARRGERRDRLVGVFDPATALEGAMVRLEPLASDHADPLLRVAQRDPDAYRHTSTPVTEEQRDSYLAKALREREQGRALPFAVRLLAEDALVGSTRLTDLDPEHRVCELGYTWYRSDLFRSGINADCKYLTLRFAFEDLGLRRVQLHTDERNDASQRAIRALGARYEGVLHRHKIRKDGTVRNTVVFAVTDLDWPEVRERLMERLTRHDLRPRYVVLAGGALSGSRAGSPPTLPDR